jgi:hypothetical protein
MYRLGNRAARLPGCPTCPRAAVSRRAARPAKPGCNACARAPRSRGPRSLTVSAQGKATAKTPRHKCRTKISNLHLCNLIHSILQDCKSTDALLECASLLARNPYHQDTKTLRFVRGLRPERKAPSERQHVGLNVWQSAYETLRHAVPRSQTVTKIHLNGTVFMATTAAWVLQAISSKKREPEIRKRAN